MPLTDANRIVERLPEMRKLHLKSENAIFCGFELLLACSVCDAFVKSLVVRSH